MHLSKSYKPHVPIEMFILRDGGADIFLRKDAGTEKDEDDNTVYLAEERQFRSTKLYKVEYLEKNFEFIWSEGLPSSDNPTDAERIELLEATILGILLGGE